MSTAEQVAERVGLDLDALDPHTAMWVAAVVTFGVGDVITTHHGIQMGSVEEGHPLSKAVLDQGGTAGMVAVKVAV